MTSECKTAVTLVTMATLLSSVAEVKGILQSTRANDTSLVNYTVLNNTSATEATHHNVTSPTTMTSRVPDWNDQSLDQAIFIYVIAGMCLVILVMILCKYVLCQRHLRSLSRKTSQDFGAREKMFRNMTDSGMVLVPD
ncbi:hypothetical protein V1264_004197 [Littorina saxatilis]|uniref:Uncharacterized protein n=1 Tax=Littorina saxatilis TaxID=31220 RepID=A0AAN9B1K0_9CAEN